MLRWRLPRFASTLAAFALLLALAACGGRMVPAPAATAAIAVCRPRAAAARAGADRQDALPPPAAGPVKVALLVPLSGANAELGKAMLEAAQLALFATGSDRLTLVPRDTGGTPDGAAGAARSAIGEGAQLILGPLLAAEVEAVKPVAARGQDQCHRLLDRDPAGRRQCLSDGLPAAPGSGARGRRSRASAGSAGSPRWRRTRTTDG